MKPIPNKHDTVSVFGLGRSGRALISHLVTLGARVYAFDDAPLEKLADTARWLSSLDVPLTAGGGGEARGSFVFRTPAMRPDSPVLCRAALRGATVMSEAEYFALLCPCPVYAVTGSDGKTTTATMLSHLLSASGRRVYLGGNIGRSLLSFLPEMQPNDACVLEISSFQACDMTAPVAVSALTNLTPNHLNWHKSLAEYTEAKQRLLTLGGRRVIREGVFPALSGVRFSSDANTEYGIRDGVLWGRGVPLVRESEMCLSGRHNAENLLCAAAAAEDAVTPRAVRELARRFAGVSHRAEWVASARGVDFIDSSIDTTPSRTAVTLSALGKRYARIHLLLGGRGKGLSPSPLLPLLSDTGRVRPYLFGEYAEQLSSYLASHGIPFLCTPSMEDAVRLAFCEAREHEAVLLSPAATSFDAYLDFEARAESFVRSARILCEKENKENKEEEDIKP